MNHKEFTLKSVDRLSLFGQYWAPEESVKAGICLVHGHGEHSSRYEPWAARFIEKGIAVITYDLRGHGRSEGKRGHTPSYIRLMQDIDVLVQRAREYFPDVPLFLYGHSMGGNLVLGYAVRRQLNMSGVIASAPWLRAKRDLPRFIKGMLRGIMFLFPGLSLHTKLDAAGISHDKEEVKKYVGDPLNHDLISLKLFFEIYDTGKQLYTHGGKVNVPVLVIHGSEDPIIDPEASREFAEKVNGDDVTLKIFDGLFHEVHHEPERDKVFAFIYRWLEERLNQKVYNK